MTTYEMLTDCERMLTELEKINSDATQGEWIAEGGWILSDKGGKNERDLAAFNYTEEDEANAKAVCEWKKIAQPVIAAWRTELKNLQALADYHHIWASQGAAARLNLLYKSLKELTSG